VRYDIQTIKKLVLVKLFLEINSFGFFKIEMRAFIQKNTFDNSKIEGVPNMKAMKQCEIPIFLS